MTRQTMLPAGLPDSMESEARDHGLPCPVCEDETSMGEPCDDCWETRITVPADEFRPADQDEAEYALWRILEDAAYFHAYAGTMLHGRLETF